MNEVLETAKGINDYGILAITSSSFVVFGLGLMTACFVWFKKIIDGLLKSFLNTNNKDSNLVQIKDISNIYFKYAVEQVCRVIKRIREENNITQREATALKIRALVRNIHEERNQSFDNYFFKGKKLSDYTTDKWIERIALAIENEIYNEAGANNKRARTNIEMAYGEIENDFIKQFTNDE